MRRVAFAVAGLEASAPGRRSPNAGYPPRPIMPVGAMPPEGVFQMVREMGLEPVGPPVRNGPSISSARPTITASRCAWWSMGAARRWCRSRRSAGRRGVHGGPMRRRGALWRAGRSPYGAMAPYDDDDDSPAGLGDGAAWAAATARVCRRPPRRSRNPPRWTPGASAGAAQAPRVRAAGGCRLGRTGAHAPSGRAARRRRATAAAAKRRRARRRRRLAARRSAPASRRCRLENRPCRLCLGIAGAKESAPV